MPAVAHVFAGIRVAEFAPARDWYERLFGRPPDLIPHATEVAWQLNAGGWLYVVAGDGAEPLGGAVVTLLVDGELDSEVAGAVARGAGEPVLERVGAAGRKATFRDPEGNRIAFARP